MIDLLDKIPNGIKTTFVVFVIIFGLFKLFTMWWYDIDIEVDSTTTKINNRDTIVFELDCRLYYASLGESDLIWSEYVKFPYDSLDVVKERQKQKAKNFIKMHKKITNE